MTYEINDVISIDIAAGEDPGDVYPVRNGVTVRSAEEEIGAGWRSDFDLGKNVRVAVAVLVADAVNVLMRAAEVLKMPVAPDS